MRPDYKEWLEAQKYQENTVSVQVWRAKRVEENYGDLDEHYQRDRLASVIDALRYTTDDERHARPNTSRIAFHGDIRNNLASYRNAIERYRRFRETAGATIIAGDDAAGDLRSPTSQVNEGEESLGQRVGLERDLQAALRLAIEQLEEGLIIIDEGAERSVDSGFIDITARDRNGAIVVIELKTGVAGQRAVAQILSYMGDVLAEEPGANVRGILVASDFDKKAIAAARMVPGLSLRKYGVRFSFFEVNPG